MYTNPYLPQLLFHHYANLTLTLISPEPRFYQWDRCSMTVQFYSFRPSIFCRWGRPLRFFKTVQIHSFGPSSFIRLDRPVFALGTVHFDSLRPSSFIPLDCPLLSLETVQIYYFRSYGYFHGPLNRSEFSKWDAKSVRITK